MFYLNNGVLMEDLMFKGLTGFALDSANGEPDNIEKATIGGVYVRLDPNSPIKRSPYVSNCSCFGATGVGAVIDGDVHAKWDNTAQFTPTGATYNPSTGALTSTSFVGALTGNASTATALATARAINGVNFDGTGDITVTAAAGTLSGNTLASGVTASSLTSVGTLGSLAVTGNATVGGNATITGNLVVNGTTTTVSSTTVEVADKNIELGKVASPSDTTADGGGITLDAGSDGDKTWNWVNSTDAWTSSEHIAVSYTHLTLPTKRIV